MAQVSQWLWIVVGSAPSRWVDVVDVWSDNEVLLPDEDAFCSN